MNKDKLLEIARLLSKEPQDKPEIKKSVLENVVEWAYLWRACTQITYANDLPGYVPEGVKQEKLKKNVIDAHKNIIKIPFLFEFDFANKKPFIFIGLTSCIGVVGNNSGTHLVVPTDKNECKIYLGQVKLLYDLSKGTKLTIYEQTGDGKTHISDVLKMLSRRENGYFDPYDEMDWVERRIKSFGGKECLNWFFMEQKNKDYKPAPDGVVLVK